MVMVRTGYYQLAVQRAQAGLFAAARVEVEAGSKLANISVADDAFWGEALDDRWAEAVRQGALAAAEILGEQLQVRVTEFRGMTADTTCWSAACATIGAVMDALELQPPDVANLADAIFDISAKDRTDPMPSVAQLVQLMREL